MFTLRRNWRWLPSTIYDSTMIVFVIALTILAIYIVVALVHFIYACFSRLSSTSWDSISEVTALAMNSPLTEDLQSTCASIGKIGIFRIPVRILTASGEHLELVFGDVEQKVAARNRIVANKKYGTLKTG
jgi:hypothetical protein